MGYIFAFLGAYLLGCSNMAEYLGRMKKINVRSSGTGNPGASNVIMLMGWGAGVLVMIHDIGKAVLAVGLARVCFPELAYADAVAGVACVIGHMFPFYMNFRGGKGVASYVGTAFMLNWKFTIIAALIAVVVSALTDVGAFGVTAFIIAVPVYMGIRNNSVVLAVILLAGSLLIAWKHKDNYTRLLKGDEFSFKKTSRGDYRVE